MEEGRKSRAERARAKRVRWSLRARSAARFRWLDAVPAASGQQDAPGEGWRQPVRHRAEWIATVHRRRGFGGIGDPPLCDRK